MNQEKILELFHAHRWQVVHTEKREARPKQLFPVSDLSLTDATKAFLTTHYPDGLYLHQIEALKRYLQGKDVGITTRTASGKSLIFYTAAVETLARNPQSKILAIYPLKALAREQEQRWKEALSTAGFSEERVVRFDGDVRSDLRPNLLKQASVLVATPDILHSWLLPNIGERKVWEFIQNIGLIIVDEVHVYSGVFGSNAAFLFRRLDHAMDLGGRRALYIVASATIRDPLDHFRKLFGRDFTLVDESFDTSGQHELNILMVRPDYTKDLLSSVSDFLQDLVRETPYRFIAFVDSRKQTEWLATIVKRGAVRREVTDNEGDEIGVEPIADDLMKLQVLPYRAGVEDTDRALIQDRLRSGDLRGVVCTSALELGIDIPHLDIAILVGVPRSMTSLQQRIGRIGRHGPGIVIVVNNGDLYSEMVFKNPAELLSRPLAESALYLENKRIQYIHAMCLARQEGEHDQACARAGKPVTDSFETNVQWPAGFVELCKQERTGEVPFEVQSMKVEAGETPHLVFPLRDVEMQFRIELVQGLVQEPLGSISYGQVMREAYPGAIYYYLTKPYRVYYVDPRSRLIKVRRERKYYTTRPTPTPPLKVVNPNLSPGNVHRAKRCGDLVLIETNVLIKEVVNGFKERQGSVEIPERYPLSSDKGNFRQELFTRHYYTTGVIIVHPAFQAFQNQNDLGKLAERIYESFLMVVPFERQDIDFATGTLKVSRGGLAEGMRFVAIYDQTYGSLRLTGRLLEPGVLEQVIDKALDSVGVFDDLAPDAIHCLQQLASTITASTFFDIPELVASAEAAATASSDENQRVRIILPGSFGLDRFNNNEEFYVEDVFFSPREGELRYRGRHVSKLNYNDPTYKETIPITHLDPVPGESRMGWYDLDTGEKIEDEAIELH